MRRHIILLSIFFSCIFLCKDLIAQTKKVIVKGTVYDAGTKETLPNANIYVGTPPKGVGSANSNGVYSITVDEGAKLTFSFTGYDSFVVTLKPGQTTLNVNLKETKNDLQDVVIRGYQKRSREVTTGSSFIVSGKEVQDVPVANVEQLLQGKVAGLNIQNNTGAPGLRGSVNIRGLSTISTTGTGNETFLQPTSPLYVIDGVPMDADKASEFGFQQQGSGVSPLSLIPQEDIASIEILKDATATALYGSRGAYGVILIQTIRGQSETPRVRYTGNFFLSKTPKLRETLGGAFERSLKVQQIADYADLDDYFYLYRTPFLADSLNAYYNNSTNWQGIFYQDTYNQTHNVTLDGGDPKFNYKANVGYYGQKGVIKNTGFDRYTLNMNMEFKPSSRLSFTGAVLGAVSAIETGNGLGLLQQGVASNGQNSSLLPGPSFFVATSDVLSSLTVRNDAGPKYLKTNMEARYELIPGLNLITNGSYTYTQDHKDQFTPAAANSQFAKLEAYNEFRSELYNRNNISYTRSVNDNHNFFINFFSELFIRSGKSSMTRLERLPNDQFEGPLGYDGYFSRGGGILAGSFTDQKNASIAAAFTYDYKKKYVFDVTYRIDGSSDSGSDDPYAKNPSIGLKWNFFKEAWLSQFKWLTNGGFRATAGKNIYPVGSLIDIYGRYQPNNFYNNNPRVGINYDQIPNPILKPKSVTQYNLGLDVSIYDGKLDLTFDTYFKQVDNELFTTKLSNDLGFRDFKSNDAALVNYGYELSLASRPLPKTSKVNWQISVNGAWNTDILTKLPTEFNGQYIEFDNISGYRQHLAKRVGRNSLANYLFVNQGVYANSSDVPVDPITGLRYRNGSSGLYLNSFQGGDARFYDANGDYVLDNRDLQVTGNTQPVLTGGLSNTVTWNSISVNIYCSYTAKRSILNNALADRLRLLADPFGRDGFNDGTIGSKTRSVVPLNDLNIWSAAGQNATYGNVLNYAHNVFTDPFRYEQTLWQEEGSYFKINQVTLSYAVNKKLAKRVGVASIRPYLSAANLVTFSGYSGPNAENVTAIGRDGSNGYPVPRTYTFGLNVEF